MYWVVRAITQAVVYSFFREITILNPERIPRSGPVIFVGNHNNQFVDASMLLAMLPRHVRFLVAEKSLKRAIIGPLAMSAGCVAVTRPQDKTFPGIGAIRWIPGTVSVQGVGTRFELDLHLGDHVKAAGFSKTIVVKSVISDTEFTAMEPLPQVSPVEVSDMIQSPTKAGLPPSKQSPCSSRSDGAKPVEAVSETSALTDTFPFVVIPRVDQSEVYESVAQSLLQGDSIGIFPEGGSHDRTELLPLKPGVAVMALSAVINGAEDLMIVPLGLNYDKAHKILSRATIQVGLPQVVSEELALLYRSNRRAAVQKLMDGIEKNLKECVISAPDFKTVKALRFCVGLYCPESIQLTPEKHHMLYHVFSQFFAALGSEHEEEKDNLLSDVLRYGNMLKSYGIADREVPLLRQSGSGLIWALTQQLLTLLFAITVGFSLGILWGPIRLYTSYLAESHRKKALAESQVKISGRDVVASYKILMMLVAVPTCSFVYSAVFALFYCSTLWQAFAVLPLGMLILPLALYWWIRVFGMIQPTLRKLRFFTLVLVGKLNAWRETEQEILTKRMQMQVRVREFVSKFVLEAPQWRNQMAACVSPVILQADSRRLRRHYEMGEFVALSSETLIESREEIL